MSSTGGGQADPSPWVITIVGAAAAAGAAGTDVVMVPAPARWYATVAGKRALLAQAAGRELRELCDQQAAAVGERLHHADWVITADPAQVEQIGRTHGDCPECLAGTRRALDWLRDHPGGEIAAGLLHWVAPPAGETAPPVTYGGQ